MHEMAITQSIVEACRDEAGDARVKRVMVEIGCLSGVLADAVRFCYDVCVAGTPLEGSVLDVRPVAGRGRCRQCGAAMTVEDWLAICACGSVDLEIVGGDELRIREMELA